MVLLIVTSFATGSKHLHIVNIDFRYIAALTLLVIVSPVTNLSFHIEPVSFMDILLYNLSQRTIKDEVMPICMIGHLRTILQSIALFCRSKHHLCYGLVCIVIMHIGLLTYITYQHHLVHLIKILLFPHTKITEMKVLSFCRWKLATLIHTLT